MTRKEKRQLEIIEKILFAVFFVSMSAMDSTAWWIPTATMFVSLGGLFLCYKVEVRYGLHR